MLDAFYIGDPLDDIAQDAMPSDMVDVINTDRYGTVSVDGLQMPDADVKLTGMGGVDAAFYSGASVKTRTITIIADAKTPTDLAELCACLKYGVKRGLYIPSGNNLFYIEGYCAGISGLEEDLPYKELEITIKCPYPWFRSINKPFVAELLQGTATPIYNEGNINAGIRIYTQDISTTVDTSYNFNGFLVKDGTGNQFELNLKDRTKYFDFTTPESHKYGTLLVDTTPGLNQWITTLSGTKAEAVPYISLTDWPVIPARSKAQITFTGEFDKKRNKIFAVCLPTYMGVF